MNEELVFNPFQLTDCFDIGVNSMALLGITIGKCVQVSAGLVVIKNVRDFGVIASNPARFLKKIEIKK